MRHNSPWRDRTVFAVAIALGATFACCSFAAEPPDSKPHGANPQRPASDTSAAQVSSHSTAAERLPRLLPTTPADALASFHLLPGFHIEQVAAEPLVQSPVAIAFDERGRMYVCEMVDYPFGGKGPRGRIRLLEETEGNGRFDKSVVFADDIPWPTGITCYGGGVFVAAAPDILYLKSTAGNGRADLRRVVFTGFGHENVQALVNSLQWGPDNRIHGATSFNPARVRRPEQPESAAVGLTGRDFSFDPETLDLRAESGGGQYGMTFDDWGRKYVCSNSDHLQVEMYEDRYLARNPFLTAPSPRVSIAKDGPAAAVFRISPVEPWRILRTKMRVAGEASGPIEGGGTPAGYFTSATGVTIYRGDAWPVDYRGQAFVGEVAGNLIHRKVIREDGIVLVGQRVDEAKEFLASTDNWFRPVALANSPNGALYVVDMYREVIEHPESLPDKILSQLDLTSGHERGRIYRIAPDGFKQRPAPRLDEATAEELVATLEHRNGWHRDTAARLLFERKDKRAIEPLKTLAMKSKLPEGRIQALYCLRGLAALSSEIVLIRLSDPHPRVREHAVRLAESLFTAAAPTDPELQRRLLAMVDDPDVRVRYQLAFSLGVLGETNERNSALARLLVRDGQDQWLRLAIFTSLGKGAKSVFEALVADSALRTRVVGRQTLVLLARQLGAAGQKGDSAAALNAIESLANTERSLALDLLLAFADGHAHGGRSFDDQLVGHTRASELWREVLDAARKTARDANSPSAKRAAAVRTLGFDRSTQTRDLLAAMLGGSESPEVQLEAIRSLDQFNDPGIGAILVRAWPALTPAERAAAADALYGRQERIVALLKAVEGGLIPASDLDRTRLKHLETATDPEVRGYVRAVAALAAVGPRKDVVESYLPALKLQGQAERGKAVFQKQCTTCHRLEGVGHEVGPNLAAMQARGPQSILVNVLDPNREVNPQFVDYLVETSDGHILTGLLAAETATSITLKQPGGVLKTIVRTDIDRIRSSGLSLMPEGFEKSLDRQAMADLIAYIMAVR